MKTKTITIRIEAEEARILDTYCEKENVSISDAVRHFMGEKLAYYKIDGFPQEKNFDFGNEQRFKKGDILEFFSKNKRDKFYGKHIVEAVRYDNIGKVWGVQTDITKQVAEPRDLFVAVHWFRRSPEQGGTNPTVGK